MQQLPIRATALLLLFAFAFGGPAFTQDLAIESLEGEEWFGLYMNHNKVGYARHALTVNDDGSVTVIEDAAFKMNMVGIKQDMNIYSERSYGADGHLRRIESRVDDIAGTNEFHARVEGDKLLLTSKVGGQETSKTLPKPSESLEDAIKQAELISGDAAIGDTVTFHVFEPMYQMEIEGVSSLEGVEERVLEGVNTTIYRIKTSLSQMGIESVAFVTEDGDTLEDQIAGGIITMRLEPEAVAKDVTYSNDVIVSNAAYVDAPIANPRERETLRLRIQGPLREEHLLNTPHQTFMVKDGGFIFVGRKVAAEENGLTIPIENAEVAQWLEPTLFVQSDNPRLRQKAKEILGDETNAIAAIEKLTHWVYENVETTFSARLTNSLEMLDHMEGDCTEHSMLFIGLARAAGIPAREVAGLIYVHSPEPGFYFHQWATVWAGKWIDVDPTFNQPIADATHIKLAEGDLFQQTKLLPIIGQLKVEVLDEERP